MRIRILVAILLLVVSASASADFVTGRAMEKHMLASGGNEGVAMFRGYVAAVADVFNHKQFCLPPNISLSKTAGVVNAYLSAHPQQWNEPARLLIQQALQAAYPCKSWQPRAKTRKH